jgi:hypothetical protein
MLEAGRQLENKITRDLDEGGIQITGNLLSHTIGF